MDNSVYFDQMKTICHNNGFVRRGTAFFRVAGDGVLQVLKYKKERYANNHTIFGGLFSLYGEIDKEWVTSLGCIPRYCILSLYCGGNEYSRYLTDGSLEEKQALVLKNQYIPWLNTITTQSALANAICMLDCASYGDMPLDSLSNCFDSIDSKAFTSLVLWNDLLKLAPFIKSGQYDAAMRIVNAVRQQQLSAREDHKKRMNDEEYLRHVIKQDRINEPIYRLFEMIERNDMQTMETYMEHNYQSNCQLLRFAMK